MAVIPVSSADFERAMSQFFREGVAPRAQFVDSDFESISRLLAQWGKPHWSCRPRTYAVLRMIDRIDLFEDFISHGLKDIAFPYTENRLPPPLNPSAKAKFLRAQSSVVTKASDLERIEGRHRHLGVSILFFHTFHRSVLTSSSGECRRPFSENQDSRAGWFWGS